MTGKKHVALFLASTLMICSAATSAFATCAPLAKGWYVEGLGGSTNTFGKSYPQINSVKRTGFGWGLNAGYKFIPYFGLEVGYIHPASTLLRAPIGGTNARDNHYAYDVAGKAMMPLGATGAEVFAKLGISRVSSKIGSVDANAAAQNHFTFNTTNQNSTGVFGGVGVGYSFMPPLQANLQWERSNGNSSTGSIDFYAFGISYILW
ncbi:hypothetical protein AYO45_03795 [Gammaproteobacteria bacterium SCGC AG-212-F23]|nr:hypothetical protein AYO45_03795 [Gammaproteobacteria bacterium SCGC AG-212-F23]